MEGYLKLESSGHLSIHIKGNEESLLNKQCYNSRMQSELCLENEK